MLTFKAGLKVNWLRESLYTTWFVLSHSCFMFTILCSILESIKSSPLQHSKIMVCKLCKQHGLQVFCLYVNEGFTNSVSLNNSHLVYSFSLFAHCWCVMSNASVNFEVDQPSVPLPSPQNGPNGPLLFFNQEAFCCSPTSWPSSSPLPGMQRVSSSPAAQSISQHTNGT